MQKQPFKFEVGEEVVNRQGLQYKIHDREVNQFGANFYIILDGPLNIKTWLPEREFYPLTDKDKIVPKQYENVVDARCAICGYGDDIDTVKEIVFAETIKEAKVILSEDSGWQETEGHWVCGVCSNQFKENANKMVLEQDQLNPVVNFQQAIRFFCLSCFGWEVLYVDTPEEAQAILLNSKLKWRQTKDGLICNECLD